MATLVKEKVGIDPERIGKTDEAWAAEEALLAKVSDYIDRNGLRLEAFRVAGEESRRNGTDRMTMEEIDEEIRATRADRALRAAKKR